MDPKASDFVPVKMTSGQRPTASSSDQKQMENHTENDLPIGLPRGLPRGPPRGSGPNFHSALLPSQVSPTVGRSMSRSTEGGVRLEQTNASSARPSAGAPGFSQGPHRGIAPLQIHGAFGAHGRGRINNTGSPISPIPSFGHVGDLGSPRAIASRLSRPSVKHLTCYYWKKVGKCRFTEEECLYSHKNTGQLAEAPQKVEPGGPSVAGRNLTQLTKAIATQEQQGIELRPGWSQPGPDWRPRPNSGSLAFRSPRSPFANTITMPYIPPSSSGTVGVTMPLDKLQQIYSTLVMLQQSTRKEVDAIKHEIETALFVADAIKDGVSNAAVTSDMVLHMASKFEEIKVLLEDIDKNVDGAKQAISAEQR